MDKIDIRDQILRTFKEKGFDEQNCGFFKEEDIIDIAESIVENLPIYVVMQQRELLIAYEEHKHNNELLRLGGFETAIMDFLAINGA